MFSSSASSGSALTSAEELFPEEQIVCLERFYSNSLDRSLFYSNMTVSLCIRQESKRNDDSVSVEELDWSAESS